MVAPPRAGARPGARQGARTGRDGVDGGEELPGTAAPPAVGAGGQKAGAGRKAGGREPTMGKAGGALPKGLLSAEAGGREAARHGRRAACTRKEPEKRKSPGDGGVARAISATVQVQVGASSPGRTHPQGGNAEGAPPRRGRRDR
ncbi:hypothetical protein caldi_16360 [Caldinitratiruptor microaerophilus]|uniref:Uncharacterized protein n=1 Tax=Caldinitratiruptor microaerophilus TaxID=671077 RepID=A0AA35G7Y9_9FIRM|nr:hypothetical protein caldi_16360 [Caldinitratiruptor microaerophilus]